MIIIFYIVLYILVVCIFRSPDWLAWMRKTYYSVNANTWFTPSHDSACSRNNHPTACLWGLFCCIVLKYNRMCVIFQQVFTHSLKSQSKVWFCPLLFPHWYYWSWICILGSQCSRSTSKWQYCLASYQDALHYMVQQALLGCSETSFWGSEYVNVNILLLVSLTSVQNC